MNVVIGVIVFVVAHNYEINLSVCDHWLPGFNKTSYDQTHGVVSAILQFFALSSS